MRISNSSTDFYVFIPMLPPGINNQYMPSYTTGRPVLTSKARDWKNKAALIVSARAGELDWKADASKYTLEIVVGGSRSDVDAYSKTVIDVVTKCLGFDDKYVTGYSQKKERFRKVLDRYTYEETRRVSENRMNEVWRSLDGINCGVYVRVKKENEE